MPWSRPSAPLSPASHSTKNLVPVCGETTGTRLAGSGGQALLRLIEACAGGAGPAPVAHHGVKAVEVEGVPMNGVDALAAPERGNLAGDGADGVEDGGEAQGVVDVVLGLLRARRGRPRQLAPSGS